MHVGDRGGDRVVERVMGRETHHLRTVGQKAVPFVVAVDARRVLAGVLEHPGNVDERVRSVPFPNVSRGVHVGEHTALDRYAHVNDDVSPALVGEVEFGEAFQHLRVRQVSDREVTELRENILLNPGVSDIFGAEIGGERVGHLTLLVNRSGQGERLPPQAVGFRVEGKNLGHDVPFCRNAALFE